MAFITFFVSALGEGKGRKEAEEESFPFVGDKGKQKDKSHEI